MCQNLKDKQSCIVSTDWQRCSLKLIFPSDQQRMLECSLKLSTFAAGITVVWVLTFIRCVPPSQIHSARAQTGLSPKTQRQEEEAEASCEVHLESAPVSPVVRNKQMVFSEISPVFPRCRAWRKMGKRRPAI